MSTALPEDVKNAPPSAALVWLVLDEQGPLCVGGIAEATGRSAATVRRALRRLSPISRQLQRAKTVRDFDPVHDQPNNTDRTKVVAVYEALVEAGHDEAGEELWARRHAPAAGRGGAGSRWRALRGRRPRRAPRRR